MLFRSVRARFETRVKVCAAQPARSWLDAGFACSAVSRRRRSAGPLNVAGESARRVADPAQSRAGCVSDSDGATARPIGRRACGERASPVASVSASTCRADLLVQRAVLETANNSAPGAGGLGGTNARRRSRWRALQGLFRRAGSWRRSGPRQATGTPGACECVTAALRLRRDGIWSSA